MSTRGAIGKPYTDEHGATWIGVYNHFDSYPEGLGQSVWHAYHDLYHGDAEKMIAETIDAHPQGYSDFPGYPYPADELPMTNTNLTFDPLFIEYAYVIHPDRLDIYDGQRITDAEFSVDEDRKKTYAFILIGSYPWDGPEPDWKTIVPED